jgi:hypothetical protein
MMLKKSALTQGAERHTLVTIQFVTASNVQLVEVSRGKSPRTMN